MAEGEINVTSFSVFHTKVKSYYVTIVIVPLLLPYLFGKSGIFTRSPLPWVFETFLFHCYHVHLPCFILLNGSLEAQSKSKCP